MKRRILASFLAITLICSNHTIAFATEAVSQDAGAGMIENIESIKTDECERRKGIVIYFANAGERVWDIAKNYAVPCKMLAEYNEICEDKLETERKIFIPVN